MKEVIKKLYQVQKEISNLPANASNPFYKSKYVPLNEIIDYIRPKLNTHGLVLIQSGSIVMDGYFTIETKIYDSESGESIGNIISMPAIADAQKMSAAMTYGKRTGLSAFFNIVADADDDGNSLADKPKTEKHKDTKPKENIQTGPSINFQTIAAKTEKMNVAELDIYEADIKKNISNMTAGQKTWIETHFRTRKGAINQDSFDNLNPVEGMFGGKEWIFMMYQ